MRSSTGSMFGFIRHNDQDYLIITSDIQASYKEHQSYDDLGLSLEDAVADFAIYRL